MAVPRPKRLRAPRLLRVSDGLHRASTIVFVLFVVYLATLAFSLFQVPQGLSHGGNNSGGSSGGFTGSSIVSSQSLNVTNSGFYPITLTVYTQVHENGGRLLGASTAASTTIASHGTAPVVIQYAVSVAPGAPGQSLLTSSANLVLSVWANVTIGTYLILPISVAINKTLSWGAPFSGASASVPSRGNITLSFQDNASFGIGGTLSFATVSSGGTSCGTGTFGVIDAPKGQQYTTPPASFTQTCPSLSGGSLDATLSGSSGGTSYSISLPAIPIG